MQPDLSGASVAKLVLLITVFLVGAARVRGGSSPSAPTSTPGAGETVQPPLTGEEDGVCEPVTALICQSVGFDNGYFPNLRGQLQSDASSEILDFLPLFTTACSGAVLHFFCSYYFLVCEPSFDIKLKPCKSFCEFVRLGCEPEFTSTNLFGWPEFLNCSMAETFPDSNPGVLGCFSPPNPQSLTVPTIVGLLTPVPQTIVYTLPSTSDAAVVMTSSVTLPPVQQTIVYSIQPSSTIAATATAVAKPSLSPDPSPTSSTSRKPSPLLSGLHLTLATTLVLLCVSGWQSKQWEEYTNKLVRTPLYSTLSRPTFIFPHWHYTPVDMNSLL